MYLKLDYLTCPRQYLSLLIYNLSLISKNCNLNMNKPCSILKINKYNTIFSIVHWITPSIKCIKEWYCQQPGVLAISILHKYYWNNHSFSMHIVQCTMIYNNINLIYYHFLCLPINIFVSVDLPEELDYWED